MSTSKALEEIKAGRLEIAEYWLKKARETSKNDLKLFQLSIQVNGQLGNYDTVITCCQKLIEINPGDGTAWSFLGTAKLATEDYSEALEAFSRAIEIAPQNTMALINQGCALLKLERLDDSVISFEKAISLNPANPNCYFNLARAYKSQGKISEAINALKTTLRLKPDLVEANVSLGTLFYENGSLDQCKKVWLNALETKPTELQYLFGLGKLYTVTGEFDEALVQYKTILDIQPENLLALCGKADLLEKRGQYEDALAIVTRLVNLKVHDVTLGDVYSRLCHRFDICDDAIRYLESLLEIYETDEDLRDLHFSLGHAYDRSAQYDHAFRSFEEANLRSRHFCDMHLVKTQFQNLKDTFSKETLHTLTRSTNQSPRPIFVVGMPRSGTTLVEQILSSHPSVYGAGELPDIKQMIVSMPSMFPDTVSEYPDIMPRLDLEKMNKLSQAYLNKLKTYDKSSAHVIDKMPHNFLNIGLICLLFPNAKIIHCMREPADTCISIFSKPFTNLHTYGTNLQTLGEYYLEYVELMKHWHKVFPDRIFDIQYEKLISAQEQYSKKLLGYCNLEWNQQCLEFYKSKRTVVTASYSQVKRPIYKTSLNRWQNYKNHLNKLLTILNSKQYLS